MKIKIFILIFLNFIFTLYAQEKIGSVADTYYDFLTLDGYTERSCLNFRTLSDSKWIVSDTANNIWKQNLKTKTGGLTLYGPEFFASYNGASPCGQNDGLLWQGKGLNAYLSAGIRYEKKGLEITFKPEVAFSQNKHFLFMPPNAVFKEEAYKNKAGTYGYYGVHFIDAPQRFGEKPLVAFGWGDSEIRYSVGTFTFGFGTQYLWLGPAKLNPILHSNNAPSYPRFDIGIRPTKIRFGNWHAGKIEARLWLGQLTESAYFDHDKTNNHNLISGLSIGYAPSFLKGFTLIANRLFLCQWEYRSLLSVPDLFFIPGNIHGGRDSWDQRASAGFSYLLPESGFEVYTEIGLNDYSPGFDGYVRYPFRTLVYTSGMRKSIPMHLFGSAMRGELMVEVSNLEVSQDFQFDGPCTFYAHHLIIQGHTNKGQWLGAGNGTGGNSQFLGFKVYHPKGNLGVHIHRTNPDNDYIYRASIGTQNTQEVKENIKNFKAVLASGIEGVCFFRRNLQLYGRLDYVVEHNPLYNAIHWEKTSKRHSFYLAAGFIYTL